MAQTTLSLKAKDENNRDREEAALACNAGPWQGPQQELGQEASRAAAGAGQSGWGAGWELGGDLGMEAPAQGVMAHVGVSDELSAARRGRCRDRRAMRGRRPAP